MEKMLQTLCVLAQVSPATVKEISAHGMKAIMEEIILPLIVHHSGERNDNHISDEFMQFMADFGLTIHKSSPECYQIMGEIALQRLSQGAVRHDYLSTDYKFSSKYAKYSASQDEHCRMSDACWNFFKSNGRLLVADEMLKDHACAILYAIIEAPDLVFPSYDGKANLKRLHALDSCNQIMSENPEIHFQHLNAENWRCYAPFLHQNMTEWTWDDLFAKLRAQGLFRVIKRKKIKDFILLS